jgi:hypothetical protein
MNYQWMRGRSFRFLLGLRLRPSLYLQSHSQGDRRRMARKNPAPCSLSRCHIRPEALRFCDFLCRGAHGPPLQVPILKSSLCRLISQLWERPSDSSEIDLIGIAKDRAILANEKSACKILA